MDEQTTDLNEQAPGIRWNSFVQPMRYTNVPTIDARYRSAITLPSVSGCNLGDFISFFFHWNHWIGLARLAVVFAALISGERYPAA